MPSPWLVTIVLLGVFLAALAVILEEPSGPALDRRVSRSSERTTVPRRPRPVRDASAGARAPAGESESAPDGDADLPPPLSSPELRRIAESTLVVLELRGEEERPLRDTYGVIVRADGALITRLRPLLGALSGVCRLPGPRQTRVPLLGVSRYDEARDLAVVRFEAPRGFEAELDVLDSPPGDVLSPEEDLWVFASHQPKPARVAHPRVRTGTGADAVELAPIPSVAPESFFAVDAYGLLVGLCRPDRVDGAGSRNPEKLPFAEDSARGGSAFAEAPVMLVTPVDGLAAWLDSPANLSLWQLSDRLFTGSFADLVAQADRARAAKNWTVAIELYARGVGRERVEAIPADDLAQAWDRLRDCYLAEVSRLMTGSLPAEAVAVGEQALEYFPREPALWSVLAEAKTALGDFAGAVEMLGGLRSLDGGPQVDARLEAAYLAWGSQEIAGGDHRGAESVYLEAIQRLPRSGRLHLELGRLYQSWQAYDDAVRLLSAARDLDASLAAQVDVFLDRIDDVLRNRSAVILPIQKGPNPIRSTVTIDGRASFEFVIDTGATHTTVPRRFAERLGYDVERSERIGVRTAGGEIEAHKIILGEVDLAGFRVRNVEAIVLPDAIALDFGLLGLNFLEHFRYGVDATRGEFRLERP